jgi:hypothetical protein
MARASSSKQQLITATTTNVPDQFSLDLCCALVSANIPFAKVNNSTFKLFLEKYTKKKKSRSINPTKKLFICGVQTGHFIIF